jgi:uncharacterized membrane protein
MVTETHNPEQTSFRFLIRGNCSMTLPSLVTVYGSLAVVSLGVALRVLFLVLWLVLPFTLLELGLLGGILYYLWGRRDDVEVISIADGQIRVEQRDHKGSREWSVPHYWASIELKHSKHRNHPTSLLLRSHGKDEEIGRCLTDEEREKLATELRHAIDVQHRSHSPPRG